MAETTVVLNRLLPWIEKKVREEVGLVVDADNEALSLTQKLKEIQQVLVDAERRLLKDERVKSWLQQLQDIAYEMEDALEEWEVENIKQQLQEAEDASESYSDSWEKKVCSFLQSVCSCFQQTVERRRIALDIKQINERLDSLAQENEKKFNFTSHDSQYESRRRIESTSFEEVSEIRGRESDKKILMSMMSTESGPQVEGDGIKIVCIVGAGGMGKTALAQLVFGEQFEVKIWVSVSDPFDQISVAKAILQVIDKDSSSLSRLEPLLLAIQKSISGKRFLLVLADVWTEYENDWRPLKVSLKSGAPGSRILVTTRKEKVAVIMDSTYTHKLEPLKDEDCWSIISQIAFKGREASKRMILERIGREIAKKCKGLPLAAKTMGGLLRFKSGVEEWQSVLKNEMWKLEEVRKDIFPLLTLSYDELHPTVKRCFSFCAIFPKDQELDVDMLIRVWMAQGFLSSSLSGSVKEMEDVGREYFEDLAMRSFFQELQKEDYGERIIGCKMHDIIHDFAQFLSKNECLIVDGGAEMVPSKDARHLNISLQDEDTTLTSIFGSEKLRSLLCSKTIPPNWIFHLKRIRFLILVDCKLHDIPKEIGNSIHIKYLDISSNPIKGLPRTICGLYNLQTFCFNYCWSLRGLPEGIHKLKNLRHILNRKTSSHFRFPQGLEKLTDLQSLGKLDARRDSVNKLGWLKDLNRLTGNLTIFIDGAVDVEEAKKAALMNKKLIPRFILQCDYEGLEDIVEALQPHSDLQELDFTGFRLPIWIPTLVNLRSCILAGPMCGPCRDTDMEALFSRLGKLKLLEDLCLRSWGMERLAIGKTSSIAFPNLKRLTFVACHKWVEWEDISEDEENHTISLNSLQELRIMLCQKLKALPHRLLLRDVPSLQILRIEGCEHLEGRYKKETGEEWDKISVIPRVVVV